MRTEEVRMKNGLRTYVLAVLVLVAVCGAAWAQDEFNGVKCGMDIPKVLIGKRDSNERVAVLEGRHKDLGLKNLGGTEVSDGLFLASWQICGSEYELLVNSKTQRVRDVLLFPAHSKTSPMFIGTCQVGGKDNGNTMLAVLDNRAGYNARDEKTSKTMLKATTAWRIDAAKANFAVQATDKMACPLGGIVTQDGGP